jgi:malate synthase
MSEATLNEIKKLERQASQIAKKKKQLEEQVQAEKELSKWYDQVLKESGFKRPRDFIKAAMQHFGIRKVSLAKTSGAAAGGGAAKAASKSSGSVAKRSRTKVTASLRDDVKAALSKGETKNSIKERFGISYPVVKKIADGGYDSLS